MVTIEEAARMLGQGVSPEDVHGRIKRGTLEAAQNEAGEWWIERTYLNQLIEEREKCSACAAPGSQYVIVKYHFHERVEFVVCESCLRSSTQAYNRKGGVLEVIS